MHPTLRLRVTDLRIKIRQDSRRPLKESILRIGQTTRCVPDTLCFQVLTANRPHRCTPSIVSISIPGFDPLSVVEFPFEMREDLESASNDSAGAKAITQFASSRHRSTSDDGRPSGLGPLAGRGLHASLQSSPARAIGHAETKSAPAPHSQKAPAPLTEVLSPPVLVARLAPRVRSRSSMIPLRVR